MEAQNTTPAENQSLGVFEKDRDNRQQAPQPGNSLSNHARNPVRTLGRIVLIEHHGHRSCKSQKNRNPQPTQY